MSDQWLYQLNGRDVGPVSFYELQELAAMGVLSTDSEVRSFSSFSWQRASYVEGLRFAGTDGSDISGDTPSANDDSDAAAKGLDDWYCNVGGLELGPLTFDELLELAKTQQIAVDDDVRLGTGGKWRRVGSIGRLMAALPYQSPETPQKAAAAKLMTSKPTTFHHDEVDAATAEAAALLDSLLGESVVSEPVLPDKFFGEQLSNESVPAVTAAAANQAAYQYAFQQAREAIAASIMAQAEAACKAAEAEAMSEVAWASAHNVDKQWWGWMGNVEFGPIEFPQVFALAKNGQLKPADFIRNGAFGQFVPSSSLPGLFKAISVIEKASEVLALAQSQAKAAVDAAVAEVPISAAAVPVIPRPPKRHSVTPRSEIAVPNAESDPSDFEPAMGESTASPAGARPQPRRMTLPAPRAIRSDAAARVSRTSSSRTDSEAATPDAEQFGDDEFHRRVEECLADLGIPGSPRIGYGVDNGVVTVRGSLASEGERLLVLRRVGAVPGVIDVVDSLIVAVPRAERPASVTIPQRTIAKNKSPRPSGPSLMERFKETVTGEYGPHVVGLVLAVMFFTYWTYPRGPVRPFAVHPVKGSVTIDGKPLPNAVVALHRVGAANVKGKPKYPAHLHPHGQAGEDGTFALETFERSDGAPDGEFVATVYLVESKVDVNGDVIYGPNLLPRIYNKPETSPFKLKITPATKELEPLKLSSQ